MKKLFLISLMVLCARTTFYAQSIIYTTADSVRIEKLLKEATLLPKGINKTLFFANKFIGKPYGSASLERRGGEDLVVNLQKFDCTTLVETVSALTLANRTGQKSFKEFCKFLRKIRYHKGRINGYLSRLHYFSSWIDDNEQQMLVHEVNISDNGLPNPFIARQKLKINYMSTHVNAYPALRNNKDLVKGIQIEEQRLTGRIVKYIPADKLSGGKKDLSPIKDGDIIAIVTRRPGLDVSHLGFAVWVNGHIHLLNASSLHHKVVLESRTLRTYMQTQQSQIGVRVIRIQ